MRVQTVFTNRRCNQNCTFCNSRSARDDPGFVEPSAVRARIDQASGASEIVLTGGEPTLRRDLVALVAHARTVAERVVLETNATLVDDALARSLVEAGLSVAVVHLPGWGEPADAVTRDPGGFDRALAGMRALGAAGVTVEVSTAVVRSTIARLDTLAGNLAAALDGVHAIVVRVPVESPTPSELVSYEEAARAIVALDAAARALGIAVRLAPQGGPPPCLFPQRERAAHLFSMTSGAALRSDHARIEACATCRVADRCPGISSAYLARWPMPLASPVTDDRTRRRLSIISTVQEQIGRELVTLSRSEIGANSSVQERIIRVNFHCNQSCRFCFVATHLPPPEEALVRAAIVDACQAGARVVLSGGEPTLNKRLIEYIALAKSLSARPVELQTNAVLLDDPAVVDGLVGAALDDVFVSLHGVTAEVSDTVTGAPGTFVRTVAGIDNLARTQIRVVLNFVLCEANQHELVPFVRLVTDRWPRAGINLSFVAPSTDVVPRERSLIPRYSEVMPHIVEAIAEADRLGARVVGFESMCGIPLCLVPTSLEHYAQKSAIPRGFDGGEFVHPPACTDCALVDRCFGLRRGYAELHGADELRPVRAAAAAGAGAP